MREELLLYSQGRHTCRGKRFTAEKIINMLREAEVLLSTGKTAGEVCRELNISEQTYYRRRKEYGGMRVEQAKKLKNRFEKSKI